MKSINCISATGRNPRKLIPQAAPIIAVSLIGVSITLSRPNFAISPSVALNAPPYTPMSSPMATPAASRSISSNMALRIPSIIVMGAMSASPAFVAWILMPVARVWNFSHGLILRATSKRYPRNFRCFRFHHPYGRFRRGLAGVLHHRLRNLRSVAATAYNRRGDLLLDGFNFGERAVVLHLPARLNAARRRHKLRLRTLPRSFDLVATVAVHTFFSKFRRRHGRFFREFLLHVEFALDTRVDFRFRFRVPDFILGKIFFVQHNRVASFPVLEHLLGNVFCRIVLRVASHAHRFYFDQSRPAPRAAFVHRLFRCVVHG